MNQSNKKPLSADQFGTLTQEILSLEKKQVEAGEMKVFLVKNEEEKERLERRKSESQKFVRSFEILKPFATFAER